MARDYGRDRYGWGWRGPKRALQKRVEVRIDGSISDIDELVDALKAAGSDMLDPEASVDKDLFDGYPVLSVKGWKWASTAEIAVAEQAWQASRDARAFSDALQIDNAKRTLEQLAPDLLRRDGD
jgi:hypothetical protein